nr:MAG TPA: hypothetical protein [Caudoviricetes sp.]
MILLFLIRGWQDEISNRKKLAQSKRKRIL